MIDVFSYLHIKKQKLKQKLPCEDYSMTYQDDIKTIAIISDGHGDRRCFRASYGSKFACYAALEISKPITDFSDNNLRKLSSQIIERWRHLVKEHYHDHHNNSIYLIYGATLSIIVLTNNKMILMNIGDSKCMTLFENDQFVSIIKNKSINPKSLSDPKIKMDIYVVRQLPKAIMFTSDGGGSFEDEREFVKKAENLYLTNRIKFHNNMLGLVDYFSSDDDVSMIWIYRRSGGENSEDQS